MGHILMTTRVTRAILTSAYRGVQLIKLEEIAIESPEKLSDKILS